MTISDLSVLERVRLVEAGAEPQPEPGTAAPADTLDRACVRVVNRLSAHSTRLVEPHSPGSSRRLFHHWSFGVIEDGLDSVRRAPVQRRVEA